MAVYSVYNHALPPPLGQVPGFIVAVAITVVTTSCLGADTHTGLWPDNRLHTPDRGYVDVECSVMEHCRLVYMRNEILWVRAGNMI